LKSLGLHHEFTPDMEQSYRDHVAKLGNSKYITLTTGNPAISTVGIHGKQGQWSGYFNNSVDDKTGAKNGNFPGDTRTYKDASNPANDVALSANHRFDAALFNCNTGDEVCLGHDGFDARYALCKSESIPTYAVTEENPADNWAASQQGSPYITANSQNADYQLSGGSTQGSRWESAVSPLANGARTRCWQNVGANGLRTLGVSFHADADVAAGTVQRSAHVLRCNAYSAAYWMQPFKLKGAKTDYPNYYETANGQIISWPQDDSPDDAPVTPFPSACEGHYAVRHCSVLNADGSFNNAILGDNNSGTGFVEGVVVVDRCSLDITTSGAPLVACTNVQHGFGNETLEEIRTPAYCHNTGCFNNQWYPSTKVVNPQIWNSEVGGGQNSCSPT